MKKAVLGLLVFASVFIFSSCYHATIETGLEPSARVFEQSFASSWIYGLVPPQTVDASRECSNGVAMVETQLSFINMLVGTITFGIYTPMHIRVTCAAATADLQPDNSIEIDADAPGRDVLKAFEEAAELAVKNKKKIHVVYK